MVLRKSSDVCSHPLENLYKDYFLVDTTWFIEMVKDCPSRVAIDYKKGEISLESIMTILPELSEEDVKVLFRFAFEFVLHILLAHIVANHKGLQVTREMVDVLIEAPFVWCRFFEDKRLRLLPNNFDTCEEYEEYLFFSTPHPELAYFINYGPSPKQLYCMLSFLTDYECFAEKGLCRYFTKALANGTMYSNKCVFEHLQICFREVFEEIATLRIDESHAFIDPIIEKTIMRIDGLPHDVLHVISTDVLEDRKKMSLIQNENESDIPHHMLSMKTPAIYPSMREINLSLFMNQIDLTHMVYERQERQRIRILRIERFFKKVDFVCSTLLLVTASVKLGMKICRMF